MSPLVISPAALDKWNIGVALASPDVEVQGRVSDLPERLSDLLFCFLQQNGGKLSRRVRENEFAALTDQEGADFKPIIRDTLLYAGLGVLFALPIAFAFAFLTERTDMPLRNSMYVLMFIPMSTPVFATALGWVLLLGPRGGTINVYLRMLLGTDAADGPFNIFSMTGLVFVHVLGIIPTMWLFLHSDLRELSAILCAAGPRIRCRHALDFTALHAAF